MQVINFIHNEMFRTKYKKLSRNLILTFRMLVKTEWCLTSAWIERKRRTKGVKQGTWQDQSSSKSQGAAYSVHPLYTPRWRAYPYKIHSTTYIQDVGFNSLICKLYFYLLFRLLGELQSTQGDDFIIEPLTIKKSWGGHI